MSRAEPVPAELPGRSAAAEGTRRIIANAASLALAYALPRLFTVAAVIAAARVLGTTMFGAYGTAAAFAVILSIIATLGMSPLLVREMARAPERAGALIRAAHGIKTASNAVMLVALAVVGRWVLGYPDTVLFAALLLGFAYAIGAYVENLAAYFQAIERMHVWTQASAAYGLVTGGLGLFLVIATGSVVWFCVAPVAGQIAALFWLHARLPARIRQAARPSAAETRRLLQALAPFAAAFVALTVHSKLDVLLLAQWRAAGDVGVYTAGYKFIDLIQALAVVAAAAVYPRLARTAPSSVVAGRWAGTRLTELALLAAVPAGAVLVLARDPIVEMLYGDAYARAVPVVALLGTAVPALVMNIVAGHVLGAAGRMWPVASLYAAALTVKLGLDAVLIPTRGADGAALAMLCTELLLAGAMLVLLRRRAAASPGGRTLAVALGTAIAAAITAMLPDPTNGWVATTVFAIMTATLYAAARIVPAAERAVLRDAVGFRQASRRSAL